MTHSRYSTTRDRTGLAITIALHAGVAAIALLAVTTTTLTRPPPPVITRNIPDTAKPVPQMPDPVIRDLPVVPDVPLPEPIVEAPPPTDDTTALLPPEPFIRPAGGGTDTVQPPMPPQGPTQAARLDRRYAGQPPYPSAARRLGEAGTVIVHVRIGRDGRVLAATLAQSSGSPRLDDAALAYALRSWRFTPALEAGVTVESVRDIRVDFRLESEG